jgi:hypothetical protein
MSGAAGILKNGRSDGLPDRLVRRRNKPPVDEPWVWLTRTMLESPAWRALSGAGKRVIERVAIEDMAWGGKKNGSLKVTYRNFEQHGIRKNSIADAIDEAVTLGWIIVTKRGGYSSGNQKHCNEYQLGWKCDHRGIAAPNLWKRFSNVSEAREAVKRNKSKPKREERWRKEIERTAERAA